MTAGPGEKKFSKILSLFLCALIWGIAFTAQSEGMQHIGPFTFTFFRYAIAALVSLPFFLIRLYKNRAKPSRRTGREGVRELCKSPYFPLKAAFFNALMLFAGVALQQFALQEASPGKAAFITATYIVWVPVIGFIGGRKVAAKLWLAVALSLVGLYFLTLHGHVLFKLTDLFLVLCAVCFAFQVIIIDKYAASIDFMSFACLSFMFCLLFDLPFMLLLEKVIWSDLFIVLPNIAYVGIFSSAVAQILQAYGQKGTNPALASLILSLESALSVLAAWVLIGTSLTNREMLGCILMFGAILLAQWPGKKITANVTSD